MKITAYQQRVATPAPAESPPGVRRLLRPRRWVVFGLAAVTLAIVAMLGWLSYSATAALNQISDAPDTPIGGLWSLLTNRDADTLQGEADDRVNVLFLGMGGKGHPGGQLTDTIMLGSFQPSSGKVALISLPRDLYVQIPDSGWGKLNSAHATGETRQSGAGPQLAKDTIGTVLNLPIHYYIRVDFAGFVELVDTLGGLDIVVDRAIADPFYPDEAMVGYDPFYLKAGLTHMDGELALKYARSRETTSDFDRSRRQQQLLGAIKERAWSAGILFNPKKITELLSVVGNHVRTDLGAAELERLLTLGSTTSAEQLVTKVYDTAAGSSLTSRTDERLGYIIVPRAGNFSALQTEVKTIFTGGEEGTATVAIDNASGNSVIGGNLALLLRGYGYQVTSVTTAKTARLTSELRARDVAAYPKVQVFLKQRFGVSAVVATGQEADFVLVVGKDYAS